MPRVHAVSVYHLGPGEQLVDVVRWHRVLAALPDDIEVTACDVDVIGDLLRFKDVAVQLRLDGAVVDVFGMRATRAYSAAVDTDVVEAQRIPLAAQRLEQLARRLAVFQRWCGTDESLPGRLIFREQLDPTLTGFFSWWRFSSASAWPRQRSTSGYARYMPSGMGMSAGAAAAATLHGAALHDAVADWVSYTDYLVFGQRLRAAAYCPRRHRAPPRVSCDDRAATVLPPSALARREVGWPRAPPAPARARAARLTGHRPCPPRLPLLRRFSRLRPARAAPGL